MSDEDDLKQRIVEAAKRAATMRQQTEDEKQQNDATFMRVKNRVEARVTPAAFWLEHNVPGMDYVANALRNAASHGVPEDGGELDGRQPVQMSREFPSTAQGEADKAEYIRQKAQEAARKASQ